MARATYRLANDLPIGWFRADLFRELERPLADLGVRIVLGRPGFVSGLVGFDEMMTATECAALADEVERLVARTIAAGQRAS
jgi:hypothetical protein